jgi:hypothetical protein
MSHPIVPALVAVAAVGLIWAGFAAWEVLARRRIVSLGRRWAAYAVAKGMELTTYAELSGVPSEVGPPLVQGEVQGVAVELRVQTTTRRLTRVEATLPGVAHEFVMLIRRRRRRVDATFGDQVLEEAPTGNKVFDAAFVLLSNAPDLARSLLDRRLAQVVLGFPRPYVELGAWENRFVLTWRGMEADPAVLDAAVQLVFTACRRRA